MKLLTKNTIAFLLVSLGVFSLGGFVFHYELTKILDEESTEQLYLKKKQILRFITENEGLLPRIEVSNEIISFDPARVAAKETLKDTLMYVSIEEEILPYRQLVFPLKLENGNSYRVTISRALMESEDLTEAITSTLLIICAALLLITLVFNYFFSRYAWKPFLKTVDSLSHYDVESSGNLNTEKTNVYEFRKLNEALEKMTARLSSEFHNLKAFTENASHEIQTPLAIIKSKTENLLQAEHLNEELARQLLEIDQAAGRLSRLNQALLLLSKIENRQFAAGEKTDLSVLLSEKIKFYEELMAMRGLKPESRIESAVTVSLHPVLADIVISNLLTNAIKYSERGKNLIVELAPAHLKVCNYGEPLRSDPEKLFLRFYKENPESESPGLGLALLKQIALINKHRVSYSYAEGMHCFSYVF